VVQKAKKRNCFFTAAEKGWIFGSGLFFACHYSDNARRIVPKRRWRIPFKIKVQP
jgi:hypothetical protein